MTTEKKQHPWEAFLQARYEAILWLKNEMGYDDKQIAKQLSICETQVYLIRNDDYRRMQMEDKKKIMQKLEKTN